MRDTTERFLTVVLGCMLGMFMVFGGIWIGARTVAAGITEQQPEEPNTFLISGDGIVKVRPDIFRATFRIEGQGETTVKAHENLQARMTRVLTRMTQMGVQEKDLATGSYNLSGLYIQPKPSKAKQTHTVRNTLQVTIRDVDHAGQYLDAAMEVGVSSIDCQGFLVEDLRTARNQARKMAAENAKERADLIAGGCGAKLGRVLSISDTRPPGAYLHPYRQYHDQVATEPAAAPGGVVMPDREDAMEPGMQEVSMTLYVTYELL